jgi:hypothetical protein
MLDFKITGTNRREMVVLVYKFWFLNFQYILEARSNLLHQFLSIFNIRTPQNFHLYITKLASITQTFIKIVNLCEMATVRSDTFLLSKKFDSYVLNHGKRLNR